MGSKKNSEKKPKKFGFFKGVWDWMAAGINGPPILLIAAKQHFDCIVELHRVKAAVRIHNKWVKQALEEDEKLAKEFLKAVIKKAKNP